MTRDSPLKGDFDVKLKVSVVGPAVFPFEPWNETKQ